MHTCKLGATVFALFCASLFLSSCGTGSGNSLAAPRTVTVTAINTNWGPDGTTNVPTTPGPIYVPQEGAPYQAIQPTDTGNGTFVYADVPAGYYWLTLPGQPGGRWYWTNSSNVDAGADLIGPPPIPQSGTPTATSFSLELSGLDATPEASLIATLSYPAGVLASAEVQNSTTYSGPGGTEVGMDVTAIHYGVVTQSEPALLGPYSGFVLGPTLTLSNLSLSNGTTNVISGTLAPSPQQSQALKIDGSQWAALFENAAPTPPTPLGSPYRLEAQPFVPQGTLATTPLESPGLFWPITISPGGGFVPPSFGLLSQGTCGPLLVTGTGGFALTAPPLIQSDLDLGVISYGDPFPADWQRVFNFCQQATVDLPPLSSTQTSIYTLRNWQRTAPPNADVRPIVSTVVNPKINGSSLFNGATLATKSVTLSWSNPALGTPVGYQVGIITTKTVTPPSGTPFQIYYQAYGLNTAQTSVTIPPQLLTAGNTYLFTITALVDAGADMETHPLRSALPTAGADVISAPILISAGAQ